MSLTAIVIVSMIILLLAYRLYGTYVANKFEIDDKNPTPAHTMRDNVDYMPDLLLRGLQTLLRWRLGQKLTDPLYVRRLQMD